MSKTIGIDFGTRALRLAVLDSDDQPQPLGEPIPLWVALGLRKDPGIDLPVKSRLDKDEGIRISGEVVSFPDLALTALRYAKAQAEQRLGETVTGCVVSIAWQSGNLRRQSLRSIVQKAGFTPARLINEPVAVALSQCNPPTGERRILVYCLGSGSLEVAISIRSSRLYRELCAGRQEELSGYALTRRMYEYLKQELLQLEIPVSADIKLQLWKMAENVKIQLSYQEQVLLPRMKHGMDFTVTRQAFEAVIRPDVQESISLCQSLVERAGLSGPSELDEIWLSGNSTNIPLVGSLLQEWSGQVPRRADEYAVAFGAAIETANIKPGEDEKPARKSAPVSPADLFKPKKDIFQEIPVENQMPSLAVDVKSIETLQAYLVEAERCLAAGEFEDALAQLHKATEFFQIRRSKIYFQWGQVLEAKGEVNQALSRYQQAVQLDHENKEYRQRLEAINTKLIYIRGQELEAQGKVKAAFKEYEQAYQQNSDSLEYRLAYERTLFQLAISIVEKARYYQSRQNNVEAVNKYREARKMLAECVLLVPEHAEARRSLKIVEEYLSAGFRGMN